MDQVTALMKNPDVPPESTSSRSTPPSIALSELTNAQRVHVLVVAFLGWLFAGLEIALFVLIHRPAMISLMSAVYPARNSRFSIKSESVRYTPRSHD